MILITEEDDSIEGYGDEQNGNMLEISQIDLLSSPRTGFRLIPAELLSAIFALILLFSFMLFLFFFLFYCLRTLSWHFGLSLTRCPAYPFILLSSLFFRFFTNSILSTFN